MRIIYIDNDYKCHVTNNGTMTSIETDSFNGKCDAYVEGYRFVPEGSIWMREDGEVFRGEMISPWKSWDELDTAQRQYEQEQLEIVKQENEELLANLAAMVDVVYETDLGRIET